MEKLLLSKEALDKVAERRLPPTEQEEAARTYVQVRRLEEDEARRQRGSSVKGVLRIAGMAGVAGLATGALLVGMHRADESAHIKQERVIDPIVHEMQMRDAQPDSAQTPYMNSYMDDAGVMHVFPSPQPQDIR
jgi:hypothetical protein